MRQLPIVLSLLIAGASLTPITVKAQQSEVMKIAQAPYFTTQKELNQRFSTVKVGWTRKQVESLLGKPQWGTKRTYNYFIQKPDGSSAGEEKAIDFDQKGIVLKVRADGGAG